MAEQGEKSPVPGSTEPDKSKIDFHFEKSNLFRVVHVDGAFGGPTPQGKILVSVYSERLPLPKVITQELKPDGSLGEEVDRLSRGGIFREVEVALTMDKNVAEAIRDWLGDQIRKLDKIEEAANGRGPSPTA